MITEVQLINQSDSIISGFTSSKVLYKFWSGLTKLFLYTLKSKDFTYDPIGVFSSSPPYFTPSHSFCSLFSYQFSPCSQSVHRISSSALSSLCRLDNSQVKESIKTILSRAKTQLSLGIIIRLDLKIGHLILQPLSCHFSAKVKDSAYHASNPNPINDDSSNNIKDHSKDKILFSKVNLPPLTVQSRMNPKIIRRNTRKQFFEPCLTGQDLLNLYKSSFANKPNSKTPENMTIIKLSEKDDDRIKEKEKEMIETLKVNRSIAEYNNWKKSQEKILKTKEDYNYFPFVEGENLEMESRNKERERKKEYLSQIGRNGKLFEDVKYKDVYFNSRVLDQRSLSSIKRKQLK